MIYDVFCDAYDVFYDESHLFYVFCSSRIDNMCHDCFQCSQSLNNNTYIRCCNESKNKKIFIIKMPKKDIFEILLFYAFKTASFQKSLQIPMNFNDISYDIYSYTDRNFIKHIKIISLTYPGYKFLDWNQARPSLLIYVIKRYLQSMHIYDYDVFYDVI